tara:strand:- start:2292 stop:2492 length:201 start_codon:yes stop_codon:yes gene_type:complete
MKNDMKKKKRHQVKSRWYYVFWGIATISVVAGQIYVGTGYRQMSDSIRGIIRLVILDSEQPDILYK